VCDLGEDMLYDLLASRSLVIILTSILTVAIVMSVPFLKRRVMPGERVTRDDLAVGIDLAAAAVAAALGGVAEQLLRASEEAHNNVALFTQMLLFTVWLLIGTVVFQRVLLWRRESDEFTMSVGGIVLTNMIGAIALQSVIWVILAA
jgi:hypothetical protein